MGGWGSFVVNFEFIGIYSNKSENDEFLWKFNSLLFNLFIVYNKMCFFSDNFDLNVLLYSKWCNYY